MQYSSYISGFILHKPSTRQHIHNYSSINILVLVIAFFCSITATAKNIPSNIQFDYITIAEGLSQNYVTDIAEDAEGFIWIGTRNGLNKYNGYEIIQYSHLPTDSLSIPSNYIEVIYQDSRGSLWIGTQSGLCRYIPENNFFEQTKLPTFSTHHKHIHIASLYEDADGILWIGSANGILYSYNLNSQETQMYATLAEEVKIEKITGYAGDILIGTSHKGLLRFNPIKGSFYQTATDSILNKQSIISLATDNIGNLWIGTQNQGLFLYNEELFTLSGETILDIHFYTDTTVLIGTEERGLVHYHIPTGEYQAIEDNQKRFGINSKGITTIYSDSYGRIWAGTVNGGVNKFDPNKNYFKHFPLSTPNESSSMQCVFAIEEEDDESILVGLNTYGVYSLNCLTEKPDKHAINKLYPQLSETTINTILKDSKGTLWVGTYKRSLILIGEKQITNPINQEIKKYLPENCSIKNLLEDSKGRIWIGTLSDGLFCYDPEYKSIKPYINVLSLETITNMIEDEQSRIWVGTTEGLFLYIESEDKFQLIFQPDKANTSFTPVPNMIVPICEVADTFWLGTRQGLIRYSLQDGKTQLFRQSDGLPGENIKGLLYDNTGKQLWISTDKGLSRLDTRTHTFTNFGLKDGIIGTEFNDISTLKDANGVFYFGSVNGIYSFHPDHIKTNPYMPKVVITNYRLYDSEFKSGTVEQATKYPISQNQTIKIPYKESIFSIDFVALNYTNPDKNQYAYKLEGYDDNWMYVGDQRMATYTNLSPGKYVFRVIASNNDGVWNHEGSLLKIQILPPWWRTYWAYSLYVLLISCLIFISIYIYTIKLQMQNQLKNEQFEREQLKKLDELKMQFFSNITHEFRTPLTLIISPLETLIARQKNSKEKENHLEMIHNNAKKILELANRLLDFSKTDSGCFEFRPVTIEISSFIKNETESFLSLAKEKQIELDFIEHKKNLIGKADPNIIAKIIGNLLSNAIKYTPEKGKVTVELNLDSNDNRNQLIISVKDNGEGIPENKQHRIFERFYQLDKDIAHGTGIGLSLVKSLIELHNGTIEVTSKPNHGSTFTVHIPLEKEEDIVLQETNISPIHIEKENPLHSDYLLQENNHKAIPLSLPKILIAEDNTELRKYLINLLADKYQILEAENGKTALELARKEIPDVILSDILMPESDGKQFCQEIKQDVQTCHIPFIMITALVSESNQIEGFSAGADDYIIKPFHPELLKSKISNILKNRQLLWRRQATLSALEADEIISEDKDSVFLLSAIDFIKANISNPGLKVEDLAKNAGMSRTSLFKKVKGLINMTPNDFIRTIRLNQAAKLLTEADLSITEITYNTGFTSPKYFRECFKKQFKVTPSEYIEKHKRT